MPVDHEIDSAQFRTATDQDLSVVADVIRSAWAPVAELVGMTPEKAPTFAAYVTADSLRTYLRERAMTMFVMLAGDEIVACGAVSLDPDEPNVGVLNRIAVRPELQGRGYGKAMVAFLEEELARRGAGTIRLGHVTANTFLHEFYHRMGYHTIGTRISDGWGIEITYKEKRLNGAPGVHP